MTSVTRNRSPSQHRTAQAGRQEELPQSQTYQQQQQQQQSTLPYDPSQFTFPNNSNPQYSPFQESSTLGHNQWPSTSPTFTFQGPALPGTGSQSFQDSIPGVTLDQTYLLSPASPRQSHTPSDHHSDAGYSDLSETINHGTGMTLDSLHYMAVMSSQSMGEASQYGASRVQAQMLSPVPTSTSSPYLANEPYSDVASAMPAFTGSSAGLKLMTGVQQYSPAYTGSVSEASDVRYGQPLNNTVTSPIVRVEHCSRNNSPSARRSRSHSRQSRSSKRSTTHLNPYSQSNSSEEADEQPAANAYHAFPPRLYSPQRNEDGSWISAQGSGQTGLSPVERAKMSNIYIPNLEEQTEMRQVQEKNEGVAQWLNSSAVSADEDEQPHTPFLEVGRPSFRRRARSAGDTARVSNQLSGLGLDDYNDSNISDTMTTLAYPQQPAPFSPQNQMVITSNHAEQSQEYNMDHDLPAGYSVHPWHDTPSTAGPLETHHHPVTANAAMMRFQQRVKDCETASQTATLGSRRRSETDMASLFSASGVSQHVIADQPQAREKRERSGSFLGNLLQRGNGNLLKRKTSHSAQSTTAQTTTSATQEGDDAFPRPRRIGSWGRSPTLDTSSAALHRGSTQGGLSPFSATTPTTLLAQARNVIRRSRSRSDIGRSSGLGVLMTQFGGPPVPTLASPLNDPENSQADGLSGNLGEDDNEDDYADDLDDEDLNNSGLGVNLDVQVDQLVPTKDGFRTHIKQLNPLLDDALVDRFEQEQIKRYNKLLEAKNKHSSAVHKGKCASDAFCTSLGGQPKLLTARPGTKQGDNSFITFHIGQTSSDDDLPESGNAIPASFPPGIPTPPVKRLPAEFECPLCFKVKKFSKPSDWTKHVHEDIQPFTCTFIRCAEPKSFKRKADWVRHENERHRQLEKWTCNIKDCAHVCYRKDNFVQHLVREHKKPEPRARSARGTNVTARGGRTGPGSRTSDAASDEVWDTVNICRSDTTRKPKDEPCRFCGQTFPSWKRLTVHLAKHMEQISMPILKLLHEEGSEEAQPILLSTSPQQTSANEASLQPDQSVPRTISPIGSDHGDRSAGMDYSYLSPTQPPPVSYSYPPAQVDIYRAQLAAEAAAQSFPNTQQSNFTSNANNHQSSAQSNWVSPLNTNSNQNGAQTNWITPMYSGQYTNNQRYNPANLQSFQGQSYPGNNVMGAAASTFPPNLSLVPVSDYNEQQLFSSPVDTGNTNAGFRASYFNQTEFADPTNDGQSAQYNRVPYQSEQYQHQYMGQQR